MKSLIKVNRRAFIARSAAGAALLASPTWGRGARDFPFTNAFGFPVRGVIQLSRSEYHMGGRSLYFGLSNVIVRGARGGSIIKTNSDNLMFFGASCSNVTFENITFMSEASGFSEAGAMVLARNVALSNIRFVNCDFLCPDLDGNAIKLIFESKGSRGTGIHFEGCSVLSAGRMGLEVQNHVGDSIARYQNITWIGGSVANTGLATSDVGCGISLSGFGSDCKVDTLFENNHYAAIENVGCSSLHLSGRVRNLVRECRPISMTNKLPMTNCSIENFVCEDFANGDIVIANQRNLKMRNNVLRVSGRIVFVGIHNSTSEGDYYATLGSSGVSIVGYPDEGFSQDNMWQNLTVDMSEQNESGYAGHVRFEGGKTTRNRIDGLRAIPSPYVSDPAYAQVSGASNNLITGVSIG